MRRTPAATNVTCGTPRSATPATSARQVRGSSPGAAVPTGTSTSCGADGSGGAPRHGRPSTTTDPNRSAGAASSRRCDPTTPRTSGATTSTGPEWTSPRSAAGCPSSDATAVSSPHRPQRRSADVAYGTRRYGCTPSAVATVDRGSRLTTFCDTATAGSSPRMARTRAGLPRGEPAPAAGVSTNRRRASW
ncbi:hypothetical protein [Actinosynnema sp. NPDC020468]|uniref:hypothetical protein n=1 Tax=Actinosynnema sp. NPDC020468 TaxID=3154488 RepID=UPI0033C4E109